MVVDVGSFTALLWFVILLGWRAVVIRDGIIGSILTFVESVLGESVIDGIDNELVATEFGASLTCNAVKVDLEVFLEVEVVTDIGHKIVTESDVSVSSDL